MLENLEKVGSATQSYLDMVETSGNQVATNRDLMKRLLHATDFQEAFRIQVEYVQSQLNGAALDAAQIGAKMAGSFKKTG